ncbi:MAG: GH92 family glycosyl hydrolase [Myxococcales bacterium]|nr:GH92 family glycosyl hydrolase [Myxococcales bacterium]
MTTCRRISQLLLLAPLALPLALLSGCAANNGPPADPTPPIELADPLIGSGGRLLAIGSTSVSATVPFGMVKPGPDTTTAKELLATDRLSGYNYNDELITAFSQLHIHGAGIADYGVLGVMPTRGFSAAKTDERGYRAAVDKASEVAAPGYYAATLAEHDIKAELTATSRVALHRYTFNRPSDDDYLLVDAAHVINSCKVSEATIAVDAARGELSGSLRYQGGFTARYGGLRVFFVIKVDQDITSWSLWQQGELLPQATSARASDDAGVRLGAAIRVDSSRPVVLKIGISFVDLAGARANLEQEAAAKDFETVRGEASAAWADALASITVAGGSQAQRRIFYSALYHAHLSPATFSDVDGRFRFLDKISEARGFTFYSDLTLWDTYRTVHPLFNLVQPRVQRDIVRSLLEMHALGGHLPRCPVGPGYGGCMISTPADIVISESYLKGITDFDVDAAYQAMLQNATTPVAHGGRAEVQSYVKLGYVPGDLVSGSVARTQENGIADAAIAKLAAKLGFDNQAQQLEARAKGYRKLWDPALGFVRGKKADGSWLVPADKFDPVDVAAAATISSNEYVEGTAWQYLWLAPHDPAGLAEMLGGKAAFVERLETFFSSKETNFLAKKIGYSSYYWHGNEPVLHSAYLFALAGAPQRTQYWVHQIMSHSYSTEVDGLAGNDDCGTLSSWYLFSAAGFYPIAGQTRYVIGSPIFSRVRLRLTGGKVLEIKADGASAENIYVQSAKLDGKPLSSPELSHDAIRDGATLELTMGASPSQWGE